jgi:hypothetical protein
MNSPGPLFYRRSSYSARARSNFGTCVTVQFHAGRGCGCRSAAMPTHIELTYESNLAELERTKELTISTDFPDATSTVGQLSTMFDRR